MKRFFTVAIFAIVCTAATAQIPYFAEANGKKSIYGYAEFGFCPGINAQDFTTYWQYGATSWFDVGFDFSTAEGISEMGFTAKFGQMFSKWFGGAVMIQPRFNFSDNYKFDGLSSTFILQGSITRNEKLFWLTNTQIGWCNEYKDVTDQLWYLGYKFTFKNEDTLTPMIGVQHTWKLDEDACPAVGLYYTHKSFGAYLWGGDLLNNNPRIGIALEVLF